MDQRLVYHYARILTFYISLPADKYRPFNANSIETVDQCKLKFKFLTHNLKNHKILIPDFLMKTSVNNAKYS